VSAPIWGHYISLSSNLSLATPGRGCTITWIAGVRLAEPERVQSRIRALEAPLLGTILGRSTFILTGRLMGSWPPGSFGTRAFAPLFVSNMDAQTSRPDFGSVEEFKGAAIPGCERCAIYPPGDPKQSMKQQPQGFDNLAPLEPAGCSGDSLRRCFLPARPRAQVCSWPGFFEEANHLWSRNRCELHCVGKPPTVSRRFLFPLGAFMIRASGPRDLF
jgi:hypothetical protein